MIAGGLAVDSLVGAARLPAAWASGIAVTLIGVCGLVVAICTYTRSAKELPISALPAAHVIQHGVYAIWRHPIYLAMVSFVAGIALLLRSKGFLFVMVPAFIVGVGLYIRHEEKVLLARFGANYAGYRHRTPLLIPTLPNLIRPLTYVLFRALFRWRVVGRENLPANPPFFVVACHRCYLDAFFLALATVFPIRFLATYEMFRTPLLRAVFSRLLCIPRRRYAVDAQGVREVLRSIRLGYCVGVFPEGERSWTGAIGPWKPEVLKLFRHFEDVPIVPVRIDGNYHAWPRWAHGLRWGRVTLAVERPVCVRALADPGALERVLRAAVEPRDHGAACASVGRAYDLSKLLYRCPGCRTFKPLEAGEHGLVRCRECGRQYELMPDYRLRLSGGSEAFCTSLAEAYQAIRITAADVAGSVEQTAAADPAAAMSGKMGIELAPGERVIDGCPDVAVSEEAGARLREVLRGSLILTDRRLVLEGDGRIIEVSLVEVSSATTESNCKLQVYRSAGYPLLQMRFSGESALKWQDYLVEAVDQACGRRPNRA